jgi:hypothetical protein
MVNLFQGTIDWVVDQVVATSSIVIVYCADQLQLTIPSTPVSQIRKTTDRQGNVKMERSQGDFLISSALLVMPDGNLLEPKAGHIIRKPLTLPDGSAVNWEVIQQFWQDIRWNWDGSQPYEQFEVMSLNGDAPWSYADPYRTLVRVHTKSKGML